jgi:hypothetical protein
MCTQRCSCPSALFVSRQVGADSWFFFFGMFLFGYSYRQSMLALISYTLFTNEIWQFDHIYWVEWAVSVNDLIKMHKSGWILALILMLWPVLVCYVGEHMVTNNQASIIVWKNLLVVIQIVMSRLENLCVQEVLFDAISFWTILILW